MLVRARDLDQGADGFGRGGEHVVDDIGELGVVARRGAEEEPERGAVVLDEAEVGREALRDPVAPGLRAARRVGEHGEEPAADVEEHRDEQRSLGREVLVEDGLRDPGRGREVVHRRGVEAALGELLARDVEQLPAALVGRQAQRARLPAAVVTLRCST